MQESRAAEPHGKDVFCLEIDFQKGPPNPNRVFKTLSGMIAAQYIAQGCTDLDVS